MQNTVEKPNAVVTGVSGLLGANFAFHATGRFRLAGLYHAHRVAIPHAECLPADLTERAACHLILGQLRPSVLFHFAAATNVDWCEDNPKEAWRINVEATRHLAEWAGLHGALLVFMSTDSVFDGEHGGYREGDSPRPINVYARTKLAGEEIVRQLAPEHIVLRANIFGWNAQPKSSLAEWILNLLERGQHVPGFTDAIFAPLLVNTLAEWILKLVASNKRGTWHLASDQPTSKYGFARAVASCFGHDPARCDATSAATANFRAKRPQNTALDAASLSASLGVTLPSVNSEIARFKSLRDEGFVEQLKQSYLIEE